MSNVFYIDHLVHASNEAQNLPEVMMLDFYSYICDTFHFDSNMMEGYYSELEPN